MPFHLIVALHVREAVDRDRQPHLAGSGRRRAARATIARTQAGADGTDYRETITVVAHHTGKIALAPATLQAIDPRDGKAQTVLHESADASSSAHRIALAGRGDAGAWHIARQLLGMCFICGARPRRSIVCIVVASGAPLAPRPRRPPVGAAAATAAPVAPGTPAATACKMRLPSCVPSAIAPTAVRVRAVVWRAIGAPRRDASRRPAPPRAGDARIAGVLRALERAAFTYDDDLAPAIDAACEALEAISGMTQPKPAALRRALGDDRRPARRRRVAPAGAARQRARAARRAAGLGEDAGLPLARGGARRRVQAHSVYARSVAERHRRHAHLRSARDATSRRCSGRSSPTSCSPTRSIARRPRCSRRCSRRCRSVR